MMLGRCIAKYLDKLEFARILIGRILLRIFLDSQLRVQHVDAQMAQRCAEEVLFGAVLEQRTVQAVTGNLFVNGNGLVVLLQLRSVLGDLQAALVGRAGRFFALEKVGRLFVVLNGALLFLFF